MPKLAKPETCGKWTIVRLTMFILRPLNRLSRSLLLLTERRTHGIILVIPMLLCLLSTLIFGLRTAPLLWNPPTTRFPIWVPLLLLKSTKAFKSRVNMLLWLTLFIRSIGVLISPVSFTPITLLDPRPTLVGSFVFLTITTLVRPLNLEKVL